MGGQGSTGARARPPRPAPDPARIPRLGADARFLGPDELRGAPCIAVDGAPGAGSVLTIAHWPDVGAPEWLAADTAAAMVDRYQSLEPRGRAVAAVSNNHVDEDGVLAAWLLLEDPPAGSPARALALDAAAAGDLGTWSDPWAPRVAMIIMGLAEPARSPLPTVRRAFTAAGGREPIGELHRAVLPHVEHVLADPERFAALWGPRWSRVTADLALIEGGRAGIADHPDLDLVVVRSPAHLDELALHPHAPRGRILSWPDVGPQVLTHRYETWVEFSSAGFRPRVDLGPVAERLSAAEPAPGTIWRADEPSVPRARLRPVDSTGTPARSALDVQTVLDELRRLPGRSG